MERKRMSRREWDLLFQRNVLGRLLTRRITFTTVNNHHHMWCYTLLSSHIWCQKTGQAKVLIGS
jgi:hypothetical protein